MKPIFDTQQLGKRPPLHLLFSRDRGLRDGDWKAVSFRGETWELYNLAEDRAEVTNLAETEPQRVQAMAKLWTDMAKDVLHASPKHIAPVVKARLPQRHPEWTRFGGEAPAAVVKPRRMRKASTANAIRARKNTQLEIVDGQLRLVFTGDDPGIAMDLRGRQLPKGPYRLSFRLRDGGKDGGEVFYTTDPTTTLPKGERLEFNILADGTWQPIVVELPTSDRVYQLRLDVSPGAGKATIAELKLTAADGNQVMAWPEEGNNK